MTWTEEERKEKIKTLNDNLPKLKKISLLKYLETKAKIRNWSTPNLCKDYTEECIMKCGLIECITTHYPEKEDRKCCPARTAVDWIE